MVVFMAIMLHKAPASIGFGTFLKHQGCNTLQHILNLLSFTISAPLFALILFFGLDISGQDSSNLDSLQYWVGVLMLLSAGSFLYVATIHILPEVYDTSGGHADHDDHQEEIDENEQA